MLLGHGQCGKIFGQGCNMTYDSEIKYLGVVNNVSKTLSPKENGNLPKYIKEHVPLDFSNFEVISQERGWGLSWPFRRL